MANEQLARIAKYKSWLELGNSVNGDTSKEHDVKCQNILHDLPIGRYVIDVIIFLLSCNFALNM